MNETSNNITTNNNKPLKHLFDTIFSYDGNVMLAAVVSLLLVILFVLLLHVYAKWFLSQARHRRRIRVLGPTTRFQHFHTFTFNPSNNTHNNFTPTNDGLDALTISAVPLFVYKSEQQSVLDCVICLSPFEDEEVGRRLEKCGHCFHVECIDMWLHSHTSCPICRAPVAAQTPSEDQLKTDDLNVPEEGSVVIEVLESEYVENQNHDDLVEETSSTNSESSSSSPLVVGCSLKRMLSRNRQESKVSTNGSDVSV